MNVVQIECTCREWWDRHWPHSEPFAITARAMRGDDLPNAPVSIWVATRNADEAAQLLRLAADALQREPEILEREPPPYTPHFDDDGEELPF